MRDLAKESTISLGAIQRLESGGAAPRRDTMRKILEAFSSHGVRVVDDASYTGAVLRTTTRDSGF